MPATILKEFCSPPITTLPINPKLNWRPERKKSWEKKEYPIPVLYILDNLSRTIEVKIGEDYSFSLPIEFQDLAEQIKESTSILDFPDNWDDEGSISYKTETLIRAIDFIIKYAIWIWDEKKVIIDTPSILPSTNGSIDLFWKNNESILLINIPTYSGSIAKFYGDNNADTKIEGEFPVESYNQGVFLCLISKR